MAKKVKFIDPNKGRRIAMGATAIGVAAVGVGLGLGLGLGLKEEEFSINIYSFLERNRSNFIFQ